MRAAFVIAALAAGAAGCKGGAVPTVAPPKVVAGGKVVLPDGGLRHIERLAWAAWRPDGSFTACGRRTEELGQAGRVLKCLQVKAAGAAAAPSASWVGEAGWARDESAVDAAPGACRVLVEDIPGDPGAPPARMALVGPEGRQPLGEWAVPREVDGDQFALEASYSPDGKWLAVMRIAVGRGEGELLVEVQGVEVRPAPVCR